jgi:type VI secretion system protein VasI
MTISKVVVACLIVLCGLSARARAQDDARALIGRCAVVTPDADRLKCYDELARPRQAAEPGEPVQHVGAWDVRTATSPVDDSRVIRASQLPVEAWDEQRVALHLGCFEGRTIVRLSRDSLLAVGRTAKVITRVDQQPAAEAQWTVGVTSQDVDLTDNPIGFLRALPATGRLFVRVEGVRNTRFESTFRLDGLDPLRRMLGNACKWPPPGAAPAPAPVKPPGSR